MFRLKTVLAITMAMGALTATAETVAGMIVSTVDGARSFAISEIKEVTFTDDGMMVTKMDDTTSMFDSGWQMTFGPVEMSGIENLTELPADSPAKVYSVDGRLVGSYSHLSEVSLADFAPGTYLIVSNGKTVKIHR